MAKLGVGEGDEAGERIRLRVENWSGRQDEEVMGRGENGEFVGISQVASKRRSMSGGVRKKFESGVGGEASG